MPEEETVAELLKRFLSIQHRRAAVYSRLHKAFTNYLETGAELAFQRVCSEITSDFNDCSKQVLTIEATLRCPEYGREDLANILRSVQLQEKQKLHMTAQLQVLKKAGHPSERVISHDQCHIRSMPMHHGCVNVCEISGADGLKDAEAIFEYNAALNEAIQGVQDAVMVINEHMEEVRYEVDELEAADQE